jgi:hypothetical protein
MNHETRTTLFSLPAMLAISLGGCVLSDAKLGAGAESSSGTPAQESSEDDGSAQTITVSDESATGPIDADGDGIGAPCDHGWPAGKVPKSKLLTFPALDCEGLVCLYAAIDEPPADSCTSDAECNAADPGVERFACNVTEGSCELSGAYVDERSMCSAFCESDADCATDEPTSCVTGFQCAPMSSLGEACCEPVCVCADDLDEASSVDLEKSCLAGTQEGCCDTLPGNGLCPG